MSPAHSVQLGKYTHTHPHTRLIRCVEAEKYWGNKGNPGILNDKLPDRQGNENGGEGSEVRAEEGDQ